MLRVLSAGSTLHGLRACADLAQSAIGTPLAISTDHGHSIRDRLLAGTAQDDVVLVPIDMTELLAAKGLVREAAPLGTVVFGGAMRAGAAPLAIGTMDALAAALAATDALLLTSAPTGDHMMNVIARLGLTDTIAPKLSRFPTSQTLLADLASRSGSALGFSPETEIRAAPGVTYIGDVPDDIQIAVPYMAAIVSSTTQADAAHKLLTFLATAPARAAFTASGVR